MDRVLASVSEKKKGPLQSNLPASDPNLPNLQHKCTLYPRILGFMSKFVCMKCQCKQATLVFFLHILRPAAYRMLVLNGDKTAPSMPRGHLFRQRSCVKQELNQSKNIM